VDSNSAKRQELSERVADAAENRVDGRSNLLHTGHGNQGDQSDKQSVLDEVLAFLTVEQVLRLNQHLQKKGVHLCSLQF